MLGDGEEESGIQFFGDRRKKFGGVAEYGEWRWRWRCWSWKSACNSSCIQIMKRESQRWCTSWACRVMMSEQIDAKTREYILRFWQLCNSACAFSHWIMHCQGNEFIHMDEDDPLEMFRRMRNRWLVDETMNSINMMNKLL